MIINTGKPPIGAMPRREWEYRRKLELSQAICRYIEADKQCDNLLAWIDELTELIYNEKKT